MALNPNTPLKASLAFMEFGRAKLLDLYYLIFEGMDGNPAFPLPPAAFPDIDKKIKTMYGFVNKKDFVSALVMLNSIKDDMRTNATYVQANCGNDLPTLLSSNYGEAKQGGGKSPVITQVLNLVPSNGRLSGTIDLVYDVPKGAHLLEGYAKLHTDTDDKFAFAGSSDNKSMLLEKLTKGTEIDIYVQAKGTLGYGPRSQIVTIVVQ